MEIGEGQVFGLGKITQHIKTAQTKKELKALHEQELLSFNQAKEEIKNLKLTLDELTDTASIESSVYRLKAAELDFNRQLATKKAAQPKA